MTATRIVNSGSEREESNTGSSRFGWAVWSLVAIPLALGTASIVVQIEQALGNIGIFLGVSALQVAIAYITIVGAARARLTGGSFRSSLRWVVSEQSLARLASTILVGVALVGIINLGGFGLDLITLNILSMLMMLYAVSRGLKYLYLDRYRDLFGPTGPSRDDDRLARFKIRMMPQRWNLIAPFIQALLITVLPSQLILLLGVTVLGWDYTAVSIITSAVLPLCGALWAQWHRLGGFMRIARIGRGRVMAPIRSTAE